MDCCVIIPKMLTKYKHINLTSYDPARKLTLTSLSNRADSSGVFGLYLLTLQNRRFMPSLLLVIWKGLLDVSAITTKIMKC